MIEDITDEARNKDKKAEGGVLYGGKPDKKGKQKAKEDREKSKEKYCKNCKNVWDGPDDSSQVTPPSMNHKSQ